MHRILGWAKYDYSKWGYWDATWHRFEQATYSGSGGSHGHVALGFRKVGKYSILSAEDRFKETFGEGEKYKGKSVAFFANKHNLGDSAVNHKQLVKDKSVLRENCDIFRRQIISSSPEDFTVVLSLSLIHI